MVLGRQQVVVRADAVSGVALPEGWGVTIAAEKLSVEEISRRLPLEHLPWVESERNMVESVRA